MCGVSGIIALKTADPEEILRYGEIAAIDQQTRGHEWIGVSWSNGKSLKTEKRPGWSSAVFGDKDLVGEIISDAPQMLLEQTRFSSQGESTKANAQPHYLNPRWGTVALGSNGDIYDYPEERERLKKLGCNLISQNDAEALLHHILCYAKDDPDRLPEGITHLMENTRASFSAWLATDNCVYLFRDRWGNRPLYFMRVGPYFIFASEDCALHGILIQRADNGQREHHLEEGKAGLSGMSVSTPSCLPSHLIPSHLIPSHLIPSHLIPSHLIPSHLIPSHLIPSHLIPSVALRIGLLFCTPARAHTTTLYLPTASFAAETRSAFNFNRAPSLNQAY